MVDICSRINEILLDGGRITANFITLENAVLFLKLLKDGGYIDVDIVQVQVSKGKAISEVTMMQAYNPVFIISGVRKR